MKITVLTENVAGSGFLAEHGLSYLIEAQGKLILFDTGHTNVFLKNAALLGIDIENILDTIVLSHGHWDHGDGLRFIQNKTLIAHPGVFLKRYHKNKSKNIGLHLSKAEMLDKFDLILSEKPLKINEQIIFLGEIPRINDYESQTTPFVDAENMPDFVNDDSALVVIENNELNIITGCSHAGICNIIEYAKQVTGIQKVNMVIGGFHLKHNNLQTHYTLDFFKKNNVNLIYPSHCTELPALAAFLNDYDMVQVKTGMEIKI